MRRLSLITGLMLLASVIYAQQVKRVILFMIDGLHWEAPERLNMPAFNDLVKEGTYIPQSYMLIPHHPTIGNYSEYNSCSFPNPVLHQGTIFLHPDNKMIQELFSPEQQTVLIVNTVAYKSIGRGFSTQIMDDTLTDADVVKSACAMLETQDPVFMRVHLQRAGQRGYDISQSTPESPWYHDIFASGSPYVQAVEHADKLLGDFVSFLKEKRLWEGTVLIVTSDHGQSRIGWHPLFDEDSWKTPLVFAGEGIGKGKKLNYFEHTDLAPTIAGLMGKEWKTNNGGEGRFVRDILHNTHIPDRYPETIKILNKQIREYNFLKARLIIASENDAHFANVAALLDNETFIEPFYHQDRILDWHKARTIQHLIEANHKVLEHLHHSLRTVETRHTSPY